MRLFAGTVGLVLVASACSGGSTAVEAPATTVAPTTTASTTTASTTTEAPTTAPPVSLSPEEQAEAELRELAMAYLTYENNELVEGRTEPWPFLDFTTGRLLDRLTSIRQGDLEYDLFKVGTLIDPVLVSVEVSGEEARIDFCSDDGTYWVDADGEQVGEGWDGGPRLGYLSAVLVEQEWLLEEAIIREDSCDPADYS